MFLIILRFSFKNEKRSNVIAVHDQYLPRVAMPAAGTRQNPTSLQLPEALELVEEQPLRLVAWPLILSISDLTVQASKYVLPFVPTSDGPKIQPASKRRNCLNSFATPVPTLQHPNFLYAFFAPRSAHLRTNDPEA